MLHILLLILKILGILLLVIIGIILLLVLTVLFVPVRYRGDMDFHGKLKGGILVSWLFRVLTARAVYEEGLKVRVRILWFTVFEETFLAEDEEEGEDGTDGEVFEGLPEQAFEESGEGGYEPDEPDSDGEADEEETVHMTGLWPDGPEEEPDGLETKPGPDRTAAGPGIEPVSDRTAGGPGIEPGSGGTTDRPEAELGGTTDRPGIEPVPGGTTDRPETEPGGTAAGPNEQEAAAERTQEAPGREEPGPDGAEDNPGASDGKGYTGIAFLDRMLCKFLHVFQTSGSAYRSAKKKYETFRAFADDEENRKTFRLLYRQLRFLFKHILPGRLKGNIRFGFEDPYYTGQVLAAVSPFYGIYARDVTIVPVFDEKVLEGGLCIRGHIRAATVLWAGIRILMNKNFRRLLRKWRK